VKIWLNQYKANRYVNNAVLITPTLHGTDMRGIGRIGVHSYPLLPELVAFVMSKPAAYQLYDSPPLLMQIRCRTRCGRKLRKPHD